VTSAEWRFLHGSWFLILSFSDKKGNYMTTDPPICFTADLTGITADQLCGGFFIGWPNPPAPVDHLRILHGSYAVELALANDQVIGYLTAISDGVSTAYLPQLEVLPVYQGRGIGSELVRRMLARLRHIYAIDLLCDPDVQPFYERLGMRRAGGMLLRNYDQQNCGSLTR
jgi:ribosomal protein S18 acetylase RimI-like enzyme